MSCAWKLWPCLGTSAKERIPTNAAVEQQLAALARTGLAVCIKYRHRDMLRPDAARSSVAISSAYSLAPHQYASM